MSVNMANNVYFSASPTHLKDYRSMLLFIYILKDKYTLYIKISSKELQKL